MAGGRTVTINIVHQGLDKLTSGFASTISKELNQALSVNQNISGSIGKNEQFAKVGDGLQVLNESLKSLLEKQDLSKERLYGQFKQAQASYDVNSPDYKFESKAQQDAKSFMDTLGEQLQTWDKFSSATEEQLQHVRKFNETMKNANRDMRSATSSPTNMNYFNLTELLMAAAARSATGYFSVGASYQQGIFGTSGAALSNLQVNTDIAQRNAISGALQAALPAIGASIGGAIGGPAGYLGGGAIGYAASLPFAMWSAASNTAEQQALIVQQQSAMINLMGGGNVGQNQMVTDYGTGIFGSLQDQKYSVNSQIATLKNSGLGYLTGPYANAALAQNRYGNASSASNINYLKTLGAYSASTGVDPGSVAGIVAFLQAKNGLSPDDIFTSLVSLGAYTGQNAAEAGQQVMYLSSETALGNPNSAAAFLANTASYGPAFQNTAMGYQGAGFAQKISMNAIGQAFGVNVPKLMEGDASARAQFMHLVHQGNSQGNIEGVGLGDIMGQYITGNASSFYSIIDSPNPRNGAPQAITAQQIQNNAPAAYQQAANASVKITNAQIVIEKVKGTGSLLSLVSGGLPQ